MSARSVAYVTAGGAGMFCGSCMRDNTLAAALLRLGTQITLVPTFTPIRTDEVDVSLDRVFLGGINVYLEGKWPALRRLPAALRRMLDHPRLLRSLSTLTLQQRSADDGALAVSLLRGGPQHRSEMDDLAKFVGTTLKPDMVNLTNLLIAGFVPALKERYDLPVVVTLQGDDIFLDSLEGGDREAVLVEMRRLARLIDGFIVFNRYYRDAMADLLDVPRDRFHVVPLGIADPEAFGAVPRHSDPAAPTVGYLARICPEKGFHRLVEAFLQLRTLPGTEAARLRVAGWLGASDREFFEQQCRRLEQSGAGNAFERIELPDRPSKVDFLSQIDLLSVPTVYREPKGIYVLEALAARVPVVLPSQGAFPEMLKDLGGGCLVPPNDPTALAQELRRLLLDVARRGRLGAEGCRRVREAHRDEDMARGTHDAWERILMQRGGPTIESSDP
ncbi:MAG: glycosyltransferase family 4 protein [Acidobacteriota bacterium]|nr:glycosyltransferase family 4 protein [Acidobacteriota bacterium]